MRVHHTKHACHALPASVAVESPPRWLHTGLVISDGRSRQRITLSHHVRCRRDRQGNVDRLQYVRYRHYAPRRGLAVTLLGPRSVRAGATVRYVARVHNRRRAKDRMVSSLWDVTVTDGRRTKRIHELRRGRTRRVVFKVGVPRGASRRFCTSAVAGAGGTRPAADKVCSRVRAAPAP